MNNHFLVLIGDNVCLLPIVLWRQSNLILSFLLFSSSPMATKSLFGQGNHCPVLLTSLLVPDFRSADNLNFDTRFFTPKSKFGTRAFSYYAPRMWNCLPSSIKESSSLSCFKNKLKTYIFSSTPEFVGKINQYANLF